MAIDIYSNNKLEAPTQKQIEIMEKNGWKHMKIPGDLWHFEFVWTPSQKSKQYTDEEVNQLAYVVEIQDKSPKEAAAIMNDMKISNKDVANYRAGNVPLTEKQKTSSVDVINSISELVNNYEWNDATWFQSSFPTMAWTDAADAEVKIDNLVAKMTLPNLGVLKWPMSDKDIQFIKDASSLLSYKQSDETFAKNLVAAYNLSARRAGIPQIESLDELKVENSTDKYFNY